MKRSYVWEHDGLTDYRNGDPSFPQLRTYPIDLCETVHVGIDFSIPCISTKL